MFVDPPPFLQHHKPLFRAGGRRIGGYLRRV